MASNRLQRINEDIQRELSSIIRTIKDPRLGDKLISITWTETTSDLRYCKVHLSVLGEVDEKQFMKGLKSASGYLRGELSRRLNLRYTPELTFQLDKSIAYGAHISKLINDLEHEDSQSEEGETDDCE